MGSLVSLRKGKENEVDCLLERPEELSLYRKRLLIKEEKIINKRYKEKKKEEIIWSNIQDWFMKCKENN